MKKLIWLGMGVGSTVGGAVPLLWNASYFSLWSVVLTAVGGVLGIWAAVKIAQYVGM